MVQIISLTILPFILCFSGILGDDDSTTETVPETIMVALWPKGETRPPDLTTPSSTTPSSTTPSSTTPSSTTPSSTTPRTTTPSPTTTTLAPVSKIGIRQSFRHLDHFCEVAKVDNLERDKINHILWSSFAPLGDAEFYLQMSLSLSGKRANGVGELGKLCPTSQILPRDSWGMYFGYQNTEDVRMSCSGNDRSDLTHFSCIYAGNKALANLLFHLSVISYFGDCVLVAPCFTDGVSATKTWALFCYTNKIDSAMKKKTLESVQSLGFNINNAHEYTYPSSCGAYKFRSRNDNVPWKL